MVGDQDAQPAVPQAADNFLNLENGNGINATERFVQKQQFRRRDKGAGNFKPTLFAAAQRIGFAFGKPAHVEFVQQVFEANIAFGAGQLARFENRKDVLLDGELSKDGGLLREIANAEAGRKSGITLKMNNVVDRDMINRLYRASQAGVQVKLIIRGICSLVCGVKDISENIEGVSIVDKYLEHMRIFSFVNNGDEKYYISSADWMTRNLDHRCEVAVQVRDKNVQKMLKSILDIQLSGNTKARILDQTLSNKYKRPHAGEPHVRAQDEVYNYLMNTNKQLQPAKPAVIE